MSQQDTLVSCKRVVVGHGYDDCIEVTLQNRDSSVVIFNHSKFIESVLCEYTHMLFQLLYRWQDAHINNCVTLKWLTQDDTGIDVARVTFADHVANNVMVVFGSRECTHILIEIMSKIDALDDAVD